MSNSITNQIDDLSGTHTKLLILNVAYWSGQITHNEYGDALNDLILFNRVIGGIH